MGCKSVKLSPKYDGTKDNALVPGRAATKFHQALMQHSSGERIGDTFDINWTATGALGAGVSAVVRRCKHKRTNVVYALKTIRLDKLSEDERSDIFQEVRIMQTLDHPNIIKIVETYTELDRLYIVMELCKGGELFDRLIKVGRFTEEQFRSLATQIASSLKYLHDNNICHRDIKLENFLIIDEDATGKGREPSGSDERAPDMPIKLIDFGFSYKFAAKETRNEVCGTASFMAPEVVDKRIHYNEASDMYSFGVLAFVMLCGQMPYPIQGKNNEEIMKMVVKTSGSIACVGPQWNNVSEKAKDFVAALLIKNPAHRMSATDALHHAFLLTPVCSQNKNPAFDSERKDAEGSMRLRRAPSLRMSRLQAFRNFGLLKKAALSTIAFSLSEDEVSKLRHSFQAFDVQKNGVIEAEEFFQVMRERNVLSVDEAELQHIFDGLDQDRTGVIKYSEFLAASMDERLFLDERHILHAFHKLDVDRSGTISKENLRVFLDDVDEETLQSCFDEADIDKSGQLSLSEFRTLVREE